jgi:hypothetical protein
VSVERARKLYSMSGKGEKDRLENMLEKLGHLDEVRPCMPFPLRVLRSRLIDPLPCPLLTIPLFFRQLARPFYIGPMMGSIVFSCLNRTSLQCSRYYLSARS